MSAPDTVASARRDHLPVVRSAVPADCAAVREVVLAAYGQYADIRPEVLSRYLADLLDLDRHADCGQLVVVDVDNDVRGYGVFYPDSSVQGFGWPLGWAGGRALAVHPAARGRGVARALLTACEGLARDHGPAVFAFHAPSFMTDAIALYERLGYLRAPGFDIDLGAHFGGTGQFLAIAYLRQLGRTDSGGARHLHCITTSAVHPKQRNTDDACLVFIRLRHQ